jgi:hypothetical protein
MRIVSLEDDEPFWELLRKALIEEFPDAEVLWLHTESEFCDTMQEFGAKQPNIFLLDVMVKWADPAENMPQPPYDVREDGYYRAGLRCRKRLQDNPATSRIPAVLFTVLEQSDIESLIGELPANTAFISKSDNFRELIETIKSKI